MPLNIKDEKTHALAKTLAERTGLSLTGAVKRALEHELERTPVDDKEVKRAKVMAILERAWSRPVMDNRTADEIIGYDENGLPL